MQLTAWQAGLLGGTAATLINVVLARLVARVLHSPSTFAPLTPLPIALGSFVGVVGATGVYVILARLLERPHPLIYGVTGAVWLASFYLPRRLLQKRPRRTNRFDGVTPVLVLALFGLHAIVALWSLFMLRFWLP